jgi:hypothetical protein
MSARTAATTALPDATKEHKQQWQQPPVFGNFSCGHGYHLPSVLIDGVGRRMDTLGGIFLL